MALEIDRAEALILFVRRSPDNPARYTIGIRACLTEFDKNKDLQLVSLQRPIIETGK